MHVCISWINRKLSREHRQLALHYTTYDLRRKKETISPTISTSDIMLLSREADKLSKEQHPFWYCRVIRMFHVDARLRSIPDSEMKRIDIFEPARTDPEVPVEETIRALVEMLNESKFGHIGLAECHADILHRGNLVRPSRCSHSWQLRRNVLRPN